MVHTDVVGGGGGKKKRIDTSLMFYSASRLEV